MSVPLKNSAVKNSASFPNGEEVEAEQHSEDTNTDNEPTSRTNQECNQYQASSDLVLG